MRCSAKTSFACAWENDLLEVMLVALIEASREDLEGRVAERPQALSLANLRLEPEITAPQRAGEHTDTELRPTGYFSANFLVAQASRLCGAG